MKFTIILEFCQECESRMRIVEVEGSKRITIKVARDLIKEYDAREDVIVDGCRIEDSDEEIVWNMWYVGGVPKKVLS